MADDAIPLTLLLVANDSGCWPLVSVAIIPDQKETFIESLSRAFLKKKRLTFALVIDGPKSPQVVKEISVGHKFKDHGIRLL